MPKVDRKISIFSISYLSLRLGLRSRCYVVSFRPSSGLRFDCQCSPGRGEGTGQKDMQKGHMHNLSAEAKHFLLSWDFTALILDQWPWDSASILSLECRLSLKTIKEMIEAESTVMCNCNEQEGERSHSDLHKMMMWVCSLSPQHWWSWILMEHHQGSIRCIMYNKWSARRDKQSGSKLWVLIMFPRVNWVQ